jgi:hypothetical protein
MEDRDATLFPDSSFKVLGGYSRNVQTGPALTTTNLSGTTGLDFALFENVRRVQDEYRLGAEILTHGVKIGFTRAWEHFREDSRDTPSDDASVLSNSALLSYRRDQPMHGEAAHWRRYFIADRSKRWALNGRAGPCSRPI